MDILVPIRKKDWPDFHAQLKRSMEPGRARKKRLPSTFYTLWSTRPKIEIGDRVYFVADGRVRGYAPLYAINIEYPSLGERGFTGIGKRKHLQVGTPKLTLSFRTFVALTLWNHTKDIPQRISPFKRWLYVKWERKDERKYDADIPMVSAIKEAQNARARLRSARQLEQPRETPGIRRRRYTPKLRTQQPRPMPRFICDSTWGAGVLLQRMPAQLPPMAERNGNHNGGDQHMSTPPDPLVKELHECLLLLYDKWLKAEEVHQYTFAEHWRSLSIRDNARIRKSLRDSDPAQQQVVKPLDSAETLEDQHYKVRVGERPIEDPRNEARNEVRD